MSRSLVCSFNRGLATVRTVATRAVHRLRGGGVFATFLLGDGSTAREAHAALVVDANALHDDLITEYTGCQIDIDQDDSGWVTIFATDGEKLARAVNEVNLLSAQIELEKTYKGIVRSVKEFGAFVECLPGQEGLVHISELADFRVNRVEDIVKLGDEIIVKCVGIDDKGRVRLSRRAAIAEKEGREYTPAPKPMDRPRGDRPERGERRPFRERGGDSEGGEA